RDRLLQRCLDSSTVVRVFRYVDDFLVLLDTNENGFPINVANVLVNFKTCLDPLEITHELPELGSLRFLDLRLSLQPRHVCWSYEPRGKKPLLNYNSAHCKLVKRGIVNQCLKNSIFKSCPHSGLASFARQVSRLLSAGYPAHLLTSVAESLLKQIKKGETSPRKSRDRNSNQRPVVIPYIHNISHNLKKIGNRANIDVVFSALNKL
ncbi:unnamed protein product, partial [Ixodes hexagonus]